MLGPLESFYKTKKFINLYFVLLLPKCYEKEGEQFPPLQVRCLCEL